LVISSVLIRWKNAQNLSGTITEFIFAEWYAYVSKVLGGLEKDIWIGVMK
jgi:hypothetical protein